MSLSREEIVKVFPLDVFEQEVKESILFTQLTASIQEFVESVEVDVEETHDLNSRVQEHLHKVAEMYSKIDVNEAMKKAWDYENFVDFLVDNKHGLLEDNSIINYSDTIVESMEIYVDLFVHDIAFEHGLLPTDFVHESTF